MVPRASRTAVFVCQGRAAAHGRLAVDRFSDPVAERLLRPDELVPVRAVRRNPGELPTDARGRLARESVRACAEIVVPRTVLIDEAVTAAVGSGRSQVVVIGAGLDTRPWRLAALRDVTVFSVDHAASQVETRDRSAGVETVAGRLVFVATDLAAQPLDAALAAAGHDATLPTVWVWEGVVPYLRRADVATTATAVARRSAAGSVLVVNYQTPSPVALLGRRAAKVMAQRAGVDTLTSDEPWRSTWTSRAMGRLLTRRGFVVDTDADLLGVARELGSPTEHSRSLHNGRVAIARFNPKW